MPSIDNVQDITPRIQYVATAAQTTFDYPFPVFDEDDIVVDVDGVTKTITTHYTVSGVGEDTGGTITFLSGMVGGEIVTIYRDMAIERLTDFQQHGPYSSDSFNDELDRITLILQELKSNQGRSLRFAPTAEVTDTQTLFSPLSSWLSKFVYINADGEPEPATGVTGSVLSQSTVGAVLYPQTAAELAAGVTPTNYYYEPGNVLRYGTNTTPGTTDMTAAIQAAIDQAEGGGAAVYVPVGTYAVTALTVDSANGITMTGDGYNSVIKGASAGTQIILLLQRTGYTTMSGVRLSNFRVDGNSGGQLDAGLIQANNCVGFVFDRLWVENGTRVSGSQGVNGIACSAGTGGGTGSLGSITNCYLRNMSKAAINWTSESVSAYIAGNVIRDCTGNGTTPGIQLNGGFNGKVIGNHITNCQGPGIYAAVDGSNNPSRNAIIANNTVHACGATSTTLADGILIANASGTPTGRIVLANNQSYDNGNATGGGAGIYVQNDDNLVLTGNLCRNNYYDGIRVLNCNHVTINGNRCTGNDIAAVDAGGIHIRGTCAHLSITANHCSDDKGSPTQNYGIILDTAAVLTYLTIEGNHLQGNVSGPLLADATAKPARISLLGELQTSDATTTTIQYFIIPDDSAALIRASFVAKKTDGSNRAIYSREALIYRDGAGGVQQGSTTTLGTDIESDATWGGITMDASGNGGRVRATGLAATTIDWRGQIEVTIA